MIKKLLLAKFNIIIFLLFAFSGNVIAQCTITGVVNASDRSCLSFAGCSIIYVGNGTTSTTLTMDSALDLTCLGSIQFIVKNNATVLYTNGATSSLKLGEGSSIIINSGGAFDGGSSCNSSDRIWIGDVLVSTCNGNAGTNISFNDVISLGGTGSATSNSPVCVGSYINLSATPPPNMGPYTYSWSGPNSFSSTDQNPTLIASSSNGGDYKVQIKRTSDSKIAYAQTTIVVNALPAITTQPTAPSKTCSGSANQTISVTAIGTGLTYSWRKGGLAVANGGVISGQGTATLNLTSPLASDAGSYDVVISGICSPAVTSNEVTVTVNPLPDNTTSTGFTGGSFCIGGQATLTFDADDTNGAPPYTLSYTDGTTTYSQNIPTNTATIFNVAATNSTGYTLKSISNNNGCVNLSPSNKTANVTFRPNPTASVSGTAGVCLGATAPNVTFTNPQAAGITINYTINGGANQTVSMVASGTTNVPVLTTTAGSFVYALVSVVYSNNPSCTQPLTGSATVTINALPTAPTIAVSQPTCSLATGTITVTAPTGMNYSIDGSTYTNTSGIFNSVTVGSYSVTAKNSSGCISAITSVTIISPAKTWNGSSSIDWNTAANWTPSGVPISSNCVTIPNVTNAPTILGTNFVVFANTLTISSGGSLLVNPTNTITVTDFVNVNLGGSLTFENNSSLVQINDVVNTGNITYKRITTPIRKFDYTYWSSPVVGYTLGGVSPNTSLFYSFDAAADNWKPESVTTVMKKGMGYIVRGPQNYDPVTAAAFPAVFVGVPNNGAFSLTGINADKLYLLGNPYPSALDADKFLTDNNSVLDGTLYFWTHNTAIQMATNISNGSAGSGTYAYTSDDYAAYNLTGGTGTDGVTYLQGGAAATSGGLKPSGKIASGQAFFVSSKLAPTGSSVAFNNTMRVGVGPITGNNSQFFKITKNEKITKAIEKHRIWLNLTNTQGAFKQMLVGYVTNATNEYDNSFDGESFDGNDFVDFYSVNEDKNLTIQGRALPFDENDKVTLGYSSTIKGTFSITIDEVDGLLVSQDIFIEDKSANVVQNLKQGAYNFSTEAGTFNDRFVLRYNNINTNKSLGTYSVDRLNSSVVVSNKNKHIKINSSDEIINKVQVFDLLGNSIYQKNNVNSNESVITNLAMNHQIVLVKIVLQNGQTVTKKIVN